VTPSPGTGLTPDQLAYEFGFRAAAGGRPASANPYPSRRDGLGFWWDIGWLNGQGGRAADLCWHRHVGRGGD
jgi:hypothetical protein